MAPPPPPSQPPALATTEHAYGPTTTPFPPKPSQCFVRSSPPDAEPVSGCAGCWPPAHAGSAAQFAWQVPLSPSLHAPLPPPLAAALAAQRSGRAERPQRKGSRPLLAAGIADDTGSGAASGGVAAPPNLQAGDGTEPPMAIGRGGGVSRGGHAGSYAGGGGGGGGADGVGWAGRARVAGAAGAVCGGSAGGGGGSGGRCEPSAATPLASAAAAMSGVDGLHSGRAGMMRPSQLPTPKPTAARATPAASGSSWEGRASATSDDEALETAGSVAGCRSLSLSIGSVARSLSIPHYLGGSGGRGDGGGGGGARHGGVASASRLSSATPRDSMNQGAPSRRARPRRHTTMVTKAEFREVVSARSEGRSIHVSALAVAAEPKASARERPAASRGLTGAAAADVSGERTRLSGDEPAEKRQVSLLLSDDELQALLHARAAVHPQRTPATAART